MPGNIGWIDMTVADETGLRDFYQKVVVRFALLKIPAAP